MAIINRSLRGVKRLEKVVGNQKIYISRTAIQPKMSKIENCS
jgi:hypothetical protein